LDNEHVKWFPHPPCGRFVSVLLGLFCPCDSVLLLDLLPAGEVVVTHEVAAWGDVSPELVHVEGAGVPGAAPPLLLLRHVDDIVVGLPVIVTVLNTFLFPTFYFIHLEVKGVFKCSRYLPRLQCQQASCLF
jgi:hypothetical protein